MLLKDIAKHDEVQKLLDSGGWELYFCQVPVSIILAKKIDVALNLEGYDRKAFPGDYIILGVDKVGTLSEHVLKCYTKIGVDRT